MFGNQFTLLKEKPISESGNQGPRNLPIMTPIMRNPNYAF